MGLFSKKSTGDSVFPPPLHPQPSSTEWPTVPTLTFETSVEVVGEYYHQAHLGTVMETAPTGTEQPSKFWRALELIALLIPEPNNSHDKNAVGVHVAFGQAGHLSREDAVRLRPKINSALRASGVAAVRACLRRAGDSYAVILEPQLATPMSAYSLVEVIERICDLDDVLMSPEDVGVQEKPNGFRLWGVGGSFEQDEAKDLAKHLRIHGYKATAREDQEFSGYYVGVTGYEPKA